MSNSKIPLPLAMLMAAARGDTYVYDDSEPYFGSGVGSSVSFAVPAVREE